MQERVLDDITMVSQPLTNCGRVTAVLSVEDQRLHSHRTDVCLGGLGVIWGWFGRLGVCAFGRSREMKSRREESLIRMNDPGDGDKQIGYRPGLPIIEIQRDPVAKGPL